MKFYKSDSAKPAVDYLKDTIVEHLNLGERVLWLVTGGSAITIAVEVSKGLASSNTNLANLSVTLTDERFVPANDNDSNWKQLLDKGFRLPGAQLLPILNETDIDETTMHYGAILSDALNSIDYGIGMFGMGPDGHIGALFPGYPELNENKLLAVHLNNSPKPPPLRMTMTIPAIMLLDEAVICANGEEKKPMLEKLKQDIDISEQPAQILKRLPKLTIFNNQIGEKV